MLGPQLQYQSLKTVLLHTDPNTRFRISAHMPSIRDVEKVIPLKMRNLDMSYDCTTVVNDTTYEVGIIRHVPDGPSPAMSDSDFDEFGFPFTAGSNVMLPGDVSFQREDRQEVREDTELDERRCRYQLRAREKALEKHSELESKGITVEDYLKSLGPITRNRASEEEVAMRHFLTYPPELLSGTIEHFKLALLSFDCRRNNTKPPFTCYVQLDITKGERKQIHRFEYNKKLFEASKGLNEALFGRRAMSIQVERFVLNRWKTVIYRLPMGFRVHANHVHTSHDTLAHESFPLLVENSESLVSIDMMNSGRCVAFETETVRRAKRLVIRNVTTFVVQRLTEGIRHLPNIEITIVDPSRTSEEIFILIQTWLTADRPVGASFCIEVEDEETAEQILRSIQTQYEMTNRTDRCVTIQKTDFTTVELFYVPYTPRREYSNKGILKIRIVKI